MPDSGRKTGVEMAGIMKRAMMGLFLLGAAGLSPEARADYLGDIREAMEQELSDDLVCGSSRAALDGSLSRLDDLDFPAEGKFIFVNIASQMLTAYENGVPVFESRVVVGRPGWSTPRMQTQVSFVRLNPDWTVPASIVRANGWLDRLASEPDYFTARGYDILTTSGQRVSPAQASQEGSGVSRFIQRPSKQNALGQIKFGLENGGAIYLHDTNSPAAFDQELRTLSHGCVRVEKVRDLAGWILGKDVGEIDDLISSGDMRNRRGFPESVKVALAYFTAWPDQAGRLTYYRDVYGLDPNAANCSVSGLKEKAPSNL